MGQQVAQLLDCYMMMKHMFKCEISGSHGGEYEVYRVFWDVVPCSHVEVDQRFRGVYCFHHSYDGGSTHF
jgi:hypothetical protein